MKQIASKDRNLSKSRAPSELVQEGSEPQSIRRLSSALEFGQTEMRLRSAIYVVVFRLASRPEKESMHDAGDFQGALQA